MRALRRQRSLRLEDAAALIGVNAQHLSRLELGDYRSPRLNLLVSIADAYNVSLDYLCGRTGTQGVFPNPR